MKSEVADAVRAAQRADHLAATPEERLRRGLVAGRQLLALYAEGRGITLLEARRQMARHGARGRRLCAWQREGSDEPAP